VIQDWNNGRIAYYSVPPESGISAGSHVSTEIVKSWGKEFSLSEVIQVEGKDLDTIRSKSQIPHRFLEVQSAEPTEIDMDDISDVDLDEEMEE
jgi:hypothetical protein